MDKRIMELLDLAATEGIMLPYPPETIIALEDTGAVVDLRTGAILIGEADKPYRWELTVAGEALAVVLAYESTETHDMGCHYHRSAIYGCCVKDLR
jgi:hypothetical protein